PVRFSAIAVTTVVADARIAFVTLIIGCAIAVTGELVDPIDRGAHPRVRGSGNTERTIVLRVRTSRAQNEGEGCTGRLVPMFPTFAPSVTTVTYACFWGGSSREPYHHFCPRWPAR